MKSIMIVTDSKGIKHMFTNMKAIELFFKRSVEDLNNDPNISINYRFISEEVYYYKFFVSNKERVLH